MMALAQQFPGATVAGERAQLAWRLPMGAVSPLWAVFGAAASVGVAYWWMSQWSRAVNVEALAPGKVAPTPSPSPEAAIAALAPVPEPTLEPLAPAPVVIAEAVADDLTRMVGIGPKLAASLAARGVTTFADIAAWTEADLADVDSALSLKGRAVREAWVAQAKRLAADA